jgi:hypothetical protein
MDFPPDQGLRDNLVHEVEALLASFEDRGIGVDLAGSHLERRKQIHGAMPFIGALEPR